MRILTAFLDGVRRVRSAPSVLLGILLVTFLLTLPLGLVLGGMITNSLGHSLAAESAVEGVNIEWWQEFSAQATGVGRAFTPDTIGFGGVLSNTSSLLDRSGQPLAVWGAIAAYLAAWIFLVGGVLDRYARNRPVRAGAFFAACGVFFFRFLRLALVALVAYGLLFGVVPTWLFGSFYTWATRDLVVERTAFFLRLALYVLFGAVLLANNLVFDYAKIRAVVEDRRSMIGAVMGAVRFVRRHPVEAFGLYLLNGLVFVALLAGYALVAPGAGGSGWSLWLGLAVTHAYLLLRLAVKLLFYASQVSLFQASLA
ncbi:MAG: hypothetical protein EHM24_32140, partial [Acidobacteria bacterium]